MRRLLMVITLMLVMLASTDLGTGNELPWINPPTSDPGDDHPWGGDNVAGGTTVGTTTRPRYTATASYWVADLYVRIITSKSVWKLILEEQKYLQSTGTAAVTTTGTTSTRTNPR